MNLLGAPSNVYIYSSFACTKVLEDGNDDARQVSLLVEADNNPRIILHMDPAKSCHDKNRTALVIRQLLKM
jgi:hypothetical protein